VFNPLSLSKRSGGPACGAASRHSGERDCVVIIKTTLNSIFVIPGLTRNPVQFKGFYVSGCRIKSGMTSDTQPLGEIVTHLFEIIKYFT
jgi:hypothetical protein